MQLYVFILYIIYIFAIMKMLFWKYNLKTQEILASAPSDHHLVVTWPHLIELSLRSRYMQSRVGPNTPLLPINWQTTRNIREAVSAIASCHLWIHLNLVSENLVHVNPPFLLRGSLLLWRVYYALTLNPFSAFGAYFPPQPHQQSHTVPVVRLADTAIVITVVPLKHSSSETNTEI